MVSKLSCPVLLSVTFFSNALKSVSYTRSFATLIVNLAKSAGTVFNFSTSILSTSVFKLARFGLMQNYRHQHVSHFLNQSLLHNYSNLV